VVLAARRGSLISADAQETLIRLAEAAQKAQEKEKAQGEQHE
jgi:hypothetical protein